MGKRTHPPGPPQDWLDEFQRFHNSPRARELREQLQRLVDSPVGREMREVMRRLGDSPLGRELRELSRHMRPKDDEEPASKPKRKQGGGRKPILTDDEIKRLQAAYHIIRKDKPTLSQKRVFDKLRKLLPPDKRSISDTTLRDHIIPPTARK